MELISLTCAQPCYPALSILVWQKPPKNSSYKSSCHCICIPPLTLPHLQVMSFLPSKISRIFPIPPSMVLPYCKARCCFAHALQHSWVSGSVYSDHGQGLRWGWFIRGCLSGDVRRHRGAWPFCVTRAFPSKASGWWLENSSLTCVHSKPAASQCCSGRWGRWW